MIEKAYAKINLSLDVLSNRDDGYHNLETIMLPLELHDTLDISLLKQSTDDFVTCDDFNLHIGKYNLCHKLIESARKKWGFSEHFRVHIHKNIFLQAGLGGGSADAAATLRGIIKLLKINASKEELIELTSQIGSDVPWAIENKPCVVKYKGEVLEPFEFNKKWYVILVKPESGLSTQEIFNKLNQDGYKPMYKIDKIKESLVNDDINSLKENVFNILESPAISILPEIQDIKNMLKNDGFDVVLMTGAGSTVFGLTKDYRLAKKALNKYDKKGFQVELTKFH